MTDAANGLSLLHVIVRAGPTNSQYNEHCLPVLDTRRVTVCSLFPADVVPPAELTLFEGDGTVLGCFGALRRALEAGDYDVVHVHAPASGIVTLLTYLRLRRSRRDLVFTVHNSWGNFRHRNRAFLRLIIGLFPLVVLCGQAAYDSLPARIRHRRADRLHVIPNGVDVERIDRVLEGHERAPGDEYTVVTVNRLIPVKDPYTALSSFARSRERTTDRLVMIGDGPLRERVEQRAAQEGLSETVQLSGVVPRDEVYTRLAAADVFVSTSAGEGLPVSVLEAMACGLPVVVSDIPPHREIARAAHGLPLVPVGDSDGFARALRRVRHTKASERARIARRLRRCVEEHYSVRSMNEAYGRLYRSLVPRGAEVARTLHTARGLDEETVGVAEKLKHRIGLLVVMAVLGGAIGFGVALVQAPVYKGETSLQVGQDLGVATDEDTMNTSAALAVRYADLARREPVLGPLVEQGYADSWRELQPDIFARVGDKNPQLVEISVYAGDREEAARLATAVAKSLQKVSRAALASSDKFFVGEQLTALQDDIVRTNEDLARARSELIGAPPPRAEALRSRIEELQATLAEQRSSYTELDSMDTSEAGALAPVDAAWTTRSPLRPTPVVLALAGCAIGLLLAVGWVHLFDRRPVLATTTAVPDARPAPERHGRQRNGHARASAWANDWAPPDPWRDRETERR